LEQQVPTADWKRKSEAVSPAGESCAQFLYKLFDYVESRRVGILSYEFGV
jgi:hypothetical protein